MAQWSAGRINRVQRSAQHNPPSLLLLMCVSGAPERVHPPFSAPPHPIYVLRGHRDGPLHGRHGKGLPAPCCCAAPSCPPAPLHSPPFACMQFKGDPTRRGACKQGGCTCPPFCAASFAYPPGGMQWGSTAGMGEGTREVSHACVPSHQWHGRSPVCVQGRHTNEGRVGVRRGAPPPCTPASSHAKGRGCAGDMGVCSLSRRHPRPFLHRPVSTPLPVYTPVAAPLFTMCAEQGAHFLPFCAGGFAPPYLCMQTGNAGQHMKGTSPPSLPSRPCSLKPRPLLCTDGTPPLWGLRISMAQPPPLLLLMCMSRAPERGPPCPLGPQFACRGSTKRKAVQE
jgi:hypothetical protein